MGYEDEKDDKVRQFNELRSQLMTKEQIRKADYYLRKFDYLNAEMETLREEWREVQELYNGERPTDDETNPNCVVNVVLPSIEGQVAAMTQHQITANFKGKGYSDQKFARTANIVTPTIFKENKIRQLIKLAGRRYLLFGNAWFGVSWDSEALDGFGMPKYKAIKPGNLLIDGRVKNFLELQEAEYMIEIIGYKSLSWVKREYEKGEDLAIAITSGNNIPTLKGRETTDDDDSFTLLHIWTKDNEHGNIQRIEMSLCGIILSESESSEPFYKHVFNKYPYSIATMYAIEGELHGFGDGKLLSPIQKLINNLYDQIVIACKFSALPRTFVDPSAEVDQDDFDKDPSHPIFAKNPKQFIHEQPSSGINPVVFNLLQDLFKKIQEMTRFSALMTGNNPERGMTATQAGIQMQQGVSGVDDKKTELSQAIGEIVIYGLGLCIEFWPSAKAFRISEESDDFEWVDMRPLANIPVMIPTDQDYEDNFRKTNPHDDLPKFMQLTVEEEEIPEEEPEEPFDRKPKMMKKGATKQIEFDVDVSIGEGMPTSKIALYNIILSLAQLQLIDERTGTPRPLLGFKQVKDLVEDTVGIKIEDFMEEMHQQQGMMQSPMGMGMPQQGMQGPINMDANVPGAGANGMMKGGVSSVLPGR